MQLFINKVPCLGFTSKRFKSKANSVLSEGYFLTNRLICLSKGGMKITL